jgi:hypothetical protein
VGVQRSERSMRASRPSSHPRRRALRAGHQLVLPCLAVKALRPPLGRGIHSVRGERAQIARRGRGLPPANGRPSRRRLTTTTGRACCSRHASATIARSDWSIKSTFHFGSMARGAVRRRLVGEPRTTCLVLVAPAFRRSSPARLTVAGRRGLAPRTAAGTPPTATPGSAWRKSRHPTTSSVPRRPGTGARCNFLSVGRHATTTRPRKTRG